MLKKPLFWIIVVIVIVILWFVFASRGKHEASHMLKSAAPVTEQATPATPVPAAPATAAPASSK